MNRSVFLKWVLAGSNVLSYVNDLQRFLFYKGRLALGKDRRSFEITVQCIYLSLLVRCFKTCVPHNGPLMKGFFDLSLKQQFECPIHKGQLFVEQVVS